jgi:hypothetical protein
MRKLRIMEHISLDGVIQQSPVNTARHREMNTGTP